MRHPRLNLTASSSAVNKLATLGLEIAFLAMSGQGPALLIGPAFLGILRFQSAAKHVFNALIAAAGKAFIDERLKIRWNV
jgi:hypothetical protein